MAMTAASYYIDNAVLAQLSEMQRARTIAKMHQQISSELAKKMAENIQFDATTNPVSPWSTAITGTVSSADVSYNPYRYGLPYYVPQQQKAEPDKPSSRQSFGTFYERLKAEIDEWLSSVKADLRLS